NIRLFHDQIAAIVEHAGDRMLFADRSLLPLLGELRPRLRSVERLVSMEDGSGADVGDALDYESILTDDDGFAFPPVDGDAAATMCSTSGTTGNPKGVLYSHRALVLHSFGAAMVDSLGLSRRDTCLAIVPMFHANGWGLPFTNTFVGAKQVHAGVAPKPETLLALLEQERVTIAAGVPAVFIGLQSAIASGREDLSRLERLVVGGSAVPPSLMEAYDRLGITIVHAWGMTETTPLGLVGGLKRHLLERPPAEQLAYRLKQGLPVPGIELKAI